MIKIESLELENVKRVHHVRLEPNENGLTVIGGKNAQGKTSILDAIAWGLGGDKFRPDGANNDEAKTPAKISIELSNGLVVERKGSKGALYVTDPSGKRAGQTLLDALIEKLALNLPKFLEMNDKEKANQLLKIIGVEEELSKLEAEEQKLYNERLLQGRIAEQKKGAFDDLGAYIDDVPDEPISAAEMVKQQQEILARNGQRMQWKRDHDQLMDDIMRVERIIEDNKKRLHDLQEKLKVVEKSPKELEMESTAEIEASLQNIEEINRSVEFNQRKRQAEKEMKESREAYDALNLQVEDIRAKKKKLLDGADLPLPDLSIENGALTYKGHIWKDMSASEQLRVATAIIRKLKPECGFILMDKLEQFDIDSLNEFGSWLEEQGLQVIATRVSTGDECQIIIEDGYAVTTQPTQPTDAPKWTAGTF